MVATIRNTGRSADFMRAAIAAGGIPPTTSTARASSSDDAGAINTLQQQATVVIVRDVDEALKHVPKFAHPNVKQAFRHGSRA